MPIKRTPDDEQTRRMFLQATSAGLLGLAGLYEAGGCSAGHATTGATEGAASGGGGTAAGNTSSSGGQGGGGSGGPGARVVQVHHPSATSWDFANGYYFDFVDQAKTDAMVDAGIMALTGAATAAAGFQKVLAAYKPGDVVALKINTNDINWGVNFIAGVPEVVNAVIRGVKSAGVPESAIRVYDAKRPGDGPIPSRYLQKTGALYPGVTYLGPDQATFSGSHPGQPVSVPGWNATLCDALCDAQHLIAIPLLKAIRLDWGNSGALKLHHGSIDNPGGTHNLLANTDPKLNPACANNLSPHVKDKLRLVVSDGLFGMYSGQHFTGPGETNDVPSTWSSFGDGATNSVLVAVDPVAIDAVMFDLIAIERAARGLPAMSHPILDACAAAGLGVQEHSSTLTYKTIDFRKIAL